jgi:hypothetical protein
MEIPWCPPVSGLPPQQELGLIPHNPHLSITLVPLHLLLAFRRRRRRRHTAQPQCGNPISLNRIAKFSTTTTVRVLYHLPIHHITCRRRLVRVHTTLPPLPITHPAVVGDLEDPNQRRTP